MIPLHLEECCEDEGYEVNAPQTHHDNDDHLNNINNSANDRKSVNNDNDDDSCNTDNDLRKVI